MTDGKSQEQRILWLLDAAWPNWVPSPELAKISLQYGSRIFALRKKGWAIVNRIEVVGGARYGFFRLGSRPVPSNKELREHRAPIAVAGPAESLFGSLERHRDDG
jgi:hypothetical protein